jgi:hypothetical protein
MDDVDFFLQSQREKQKSLESLNGKFEDWWRVFPDEQWGELPAKRKQGEADLKELTAVIKECRPIYNKQKQIDLDELGDYIVTDTIRRRFIDTDPYFSKPAKILDALIKMDNLDILELAKLDRWERGQIFKDITCGLREGFCAAAKLKQVIEENASDIAEARKRKEYLDRRYPDRKVTMINAPVKISPASSEPRVETEFNPGDR